MSSVTLNLPIAEMQTRISDLQAQLNDTQADVNIFFLIIMGILIFLMQAGFAFLEAGSVRSKNTTTILLKNTIDACAGAVIYWAVGFAFAFGKDSNEFIAYNQFFLIETESEQYASFFFQYVFAATAVTIVSGAMAERATMFAYLVYSLFITGFVYPVVTHWAWSGEGWLSEEINYIDFAGSGVVHVVGGTAGLVGCVLLGPRIGKFDEQGNPTNVPGHSTVLTTLGFFILWFGFFAFNGGSELGITGGSSSASVARAVVNTTLAGSSGAFVSLAVVKFQVKFGQSVKLFGKSVTVVNPFAGHWSLMVAINGSITGMVAICAGANIVEPWAAFVIGCAAGVVYCAWSKTLENLKIDDPLNAIAVHLGGGLWGVIAAPLFANSNRLDQIPDGGVLYAWDGKAFLALGKNVCGVATIIAWTAFWSVLTFGFLRIVGHLRVSEEAEIDGLDFIEGEPAYPIDLAVFTD